MLEKCQFTAEPRNLFQGREVVAGGVEEYNERRLHAGLPYIESVEYFRGNPAARLEQRRQKRQTGRAKRIALHLGWAGKNVPTTSSAGRSLPFQKPSLVSFDKKRSGLLPPCGRETDNACR